MAERRMFAKTIVTSDAFLDMPITARCLYFTIGMFADDDGFVNNPKSIMRQIGASEDDMRVLIARKFLIPFDSGVIVIKHWRINNYLQKDRYNPTKYVDEKDTLVIEPNGSYRLTNEENPMYTHDVYTQVRLGEIRLGKESIEESDGARPPKHKRGKYGHVRITDEEYERLIADLGAEETERVISYVDSYAEESGKRYKNWNLTLRRASRDGWGKKAGTEAARNERDYSFDGFKKGV